MKLGSRYTMLLTLLFLAVEVALPAEVRPQDPGRALRLEVRPDGSMAYLDREGNVVGWFDPGAEDNVPATSFTAPQVPGWPLVLGEVSSTPAVADVDVDGSLEVVFSTISWDGLLYVVDASGTVRDGWPLSGFRSGHSASLADVDGDGALEIFTQGGGNMAGLRPDGTSLPSWPIVGSGFATAAIGDLDGDGTWEIVAVDRSGHAFVWGAEGADRPGWPVTFPSPFAQSNKGPAVGDATGDGVLEIAFPLQGS